MARYFCPLCEADGDAPVCVKHDVPTIHRSAEAKAPVRLEVGTILVKRYRLDGLLSQGGMGALLLATDLQQDLKVVVKVLKGQRIQVPANVRRFYQEARLARSLDHPSVVRIYEFGVDTPTRAPFLAMEYVHGQTLKALVLAEGPLSEARAAPLFADVSYGLAAAHAAGVLHRDLKPSNVMVIKDGVRERARVLDFGLAKDLALDPSTAPLTQPGRTVGTPSYMAPEQVSNRTQDFSTDLYGVGCMLHAALTGTPPFKGEDVVEVMRRQLKEQPPELPSVLSDGQAPSPRLLELHRNLLKKARQDRPGSTTEVAEIFASMVPSQEHLQGATRRLTPPRDRELSFGGPTARIDTDRIDDSGINFQTVVETSRDNSETKLKTVPPEVPTLMQHRPSDDDSLSMSLPPQGADTSSVELDAQTMPVPVQETFPAEAETLAEFAPRSPSAVPEALDTRPVPSPSLRDADDTRIDNAESLRTLLRADSDRTAAPLDPAEKAREGPIFGESLIIPNPLLTGRAGSPLPGTEPLPVVTFERPNSDRTMVVMLLLATVAVVVAIVAAVALRRGRPAATPPPAVRATSPKTVVPSVAPRRGEMIRIDSSPGQARVWMDGRDLGLTPVVVSRPSGGLAAQLRLELLGHRPQEVQLTEASPKTMKVRLTPR